MKNDNLHQNRNEVNPLRIQLPGSKRTEGMAEDELIDAVAAQVLEKYRAAFENLAK